MPHDQERMNHFEEIWQSVRDFYCGGTCVSERGLQSELFEQLRQHLKACNVVVEPTWWNTVDGRRTPDLVIAQDGYITDIFEIKFVPHHYADWLEDIGKLRRYPHPDGPGSYPVDICPETGQFGDDIPLHENCRLHFVVASRHDDYAICNPIPQADGQLPINRWCGPVNDPVPDWYVEFNAAD